MSSAHTDSRILRGMEAQLKRREERLAAGEKAIGWKVGFGAPASMQSLGIDAPLIGFMTDKSLIPSGSEVSVAGWTKTAVEPEVALRLGSDVEGLVDRKTARAAIASISPSIELADVNFAPTDIESILEANIFHRGVILGHPEDSRVGLVLDGLIGRIYRDGVETASIIELQALPGDFVEIVQHVASLLNVFGEKLRAGDILITGSIVPPILSTTSEGVRFFLDPIADVSVHVTV